jgi:hypothetical protein
MKAAILINHYTAALFYNDILTSLGFQTYIPCQCGIEPLTMQEQSKLIRTIPHDEEISILDEYDFYLPATLTEQKKIAMILNSKFDLIFTYHPINVNKYLLNSTKKVYFIIWGEISDDPFIHYRKRIKFLFKPTMYDVIRKTSEKYFILAHHYLLEYVPESPTFISLPLGLNREIEKYARSRKANHNGKIVIIISRIKSLIKVEPYLLKFLTEIFSHFSNHHFELIGKENENLFGSIPNVKMLQFETTAELYSHISNSFISINYSIHRNVLQFSPLEASCFNVPQFYMRGSAVDKLLNEDNHFRYNDFQDLKLKLGIYLADPESYQAIADNNNKRLYELKSYSNSLDIWSRHFKSNYHNLKFA